MMFIVMHGGYLLSTGMYVLDGGYSPLSHFEDNGGYLLCTANLCMKVDTHCILLFF